MDLQRIFKKRSAYDTPDRPSCYSEYSAEQRGVLSYALDVDDCFTYRVVYREH
jgi:hypothetical protein